MRIFISGGCKNGKSYYAQRLAKAQQAGGSLYYIATMQAVDAEDEERIARHRLERAGMGFTTIEQPVDIEGILHKCETGGSFLLDSLTALLMNEMFRGDGSVNKKSKEKILDGLRQITLGIDDIVFVSDYIYSDALLYGPSTEEYMRSLAEIDRAVAESCEAVVEAAYANVAVHKGKKAFGELYEKIH